MEPRRLRIMPFLGHDTENPADHSPCGEQLPVEVPAPRAAVQIVSFMEFLKVSGGSRRHLATVRSSTQSQRARGSQRDLQVSIINTAWQSYAHITALRCDSVLPELMGMSKIVSGTLYAADWPSPSVKPRAFGASPCDLAA
jgi:hypothetical protein